MFPAVRFQRWPQKSPKLEAMNGLLKCGMMCRPTDLQHSCGLSLALHSARTAAARALKRSERTCT